MMEIAKPQYVHVIANPASPNSGNLLRTLNDTFRKAKIRWEFSVTHDVGDGERLAKQAVEAGADVVASFGGDGTVMDVAAGLVGGEVPLMILPGGTGNLLAFELKLPREVQHCLNLLTESHIRLRAVDIGKMGDRPFLLRVGCGFETEVLADATRQMKDQFGKWAYVFGAAKALTEVRSAEYEIILDDGAPFTTTAVACFVANAGVVGIGDLDLSPEIDMDDGKLDVVLVRKVDVEGIVSLVRMMMGDHPQESGDPSVDASHLVRHWQVKKVEIRTDPPLRMQADGDLCEQETPQVIEVVPGGLKVVVG